MGGVTCELQLLGSKSVWCCEVCSETVLQAFFVATVRVLELSAEPCLESKPCGDPQGRLSCAAEERAAAVTIPLMIQILHCALRTLNNGNYMVYSLLWVMQDLYHQLYVPGPPAGAVWNALQMGGGVVDRACMCLGQSIVVGTVPPHFARTAVSRQAASKIIDTNILGEFLKFPSSDI